MRITDEDVASLAAMPVIPEADGEAFWNPSRSVQEKFVGAGFGDAYDQGARFLNYVETHCQIGGCGRLLDFGCGWGRMLKLLRFKGELEDVEMHGCDVGPAALETVRRTIPGVFTSLCEPWPTTRYADNTFGLVFAFSVFSHLNEDAHRRWGQEFGRILRPSGFAVITLQGAAFLKMCGEYGSGQRPKTHPWHEKLAASFQEPGVMDRFNSGEFLFSESRPEGFDPSYGEAVVPRGYVQSYWSSVGFELVDWDETYGQNFCVLRRA